MIVYKGKLNSGDMYDVCVLTLDNLEEIIELQKYGAAKIDDPSFLQTLSEEEYTYILSGKGLMVGCYVDSRLIAIRALMEPPLDEEHLGYDVGLTDEELGDVIYQEISIVDPAFRGNRLQQMLAMIIMEQLQSSTSKYKYVCTTVAPFNIPSLKDKFNQGMTIKALKQIYGEKLRYVFIKNIEDKKQRMWNETKIIAMDQTIEQQHVLNDGWVGFKMIEQDDKFLIEYGK